MEQLEFLKPLLEAYAGQYGWAVTLLTYIGTARVVFKPVMTAVESVVISTPSKSDDTKLEKIKKSKGYKMFVWVLDFLGSVKLNKIL